VRSNERLLEENEIEKIFWIQKLIMIGINKSYLDGFRNAFRVRIRVRNQEGERGKLRERRRERGRD